MSHNTHSQNPNDNRNANQNAGGTQQRTAAPQNPNQAGTNKPGQQGGQQGQPQQQNQQNQNQQNPPGNTQRNSDATQRGDRDQGKNANPNQHANQPVKH